MTTDNVLDSAYSWRRLVISLMIAVIGNAGMWASIVVLPAMQAEFATGRSVAALPYTFTMFGYAAGNLLIGRFVDRWGVTRALSVAALALAVGYVLASVTTSFWVICALQLVLGIGTAASFGPLVADVSLWFLRRRGIAVALAASGNYLSGAIWPVLLAGILAQDGWRAAYLVLAASAVGVMIPLALLLRRRVPAEALAQSDAQSAARAQATGIPPRQLMWLLGLAGVACCVAMSMPQVHIVAYSIDLGFGPEAGARMLSLMLFGGVVSRIISGFLADRLGGVRTVLIGSALQALALLLYIPISGLGGLYAVSLIFGLSQGGIVPSYAVIVREYMPAREAGARTGFVIMGTILGMALGGWMSGWIYDQTGSYAMAFVNGFAWNVLNLAIMATVLLRGRPRGTPQPA